MAKDYRDQAIELLEEDDAYAYFIDAGPGWGGGYLVFAKAGYRKRRSVLHVRTHAEAEGRIKEFMEKREERRIDAITEQVQRTHDVTDENYVELSLDETQTRLAQLYPDGSAIIQVAGGHCIDLNAVQAMHLANSILAQSRTVTPLSAQEFYEGVEGDPEYYAWVEFAHQPKASEY